MTEIKPPTKFDCSTIYQPCIFLAGSIEMGKAEPWQAKVVEALSDLEITILNPRRDDWDSSWVQSKDNPKFREQVLWELKGIRTCDLVVFYLQPETLSPISLLELGMCIGRNTKLFVVCPDGFWRKGNVDIVTEFYGVKQYATLWQLIEAVRWWVKP